MDSDSSHSRQVTIEAQAWSAAVTDIETIVQQAADAALDRCLAAFLGPKMRPVDLSILLTDDATIQNLNREWRGKDRPTNVLSFPGVDPQELVFLPTGAPVLLGDIVVAYETVEREARERGIGIDDHLTHLVIHGTLHLLGYDHEDDDEAVLMEGLETELLAGLGIADPHVLPPARDDGDRLAAAAP
jgi:probable rRNA maturation factor